MKLGNFSLLDDQQDNNELDQLIRTFNATDASYPKVSVLDLWQQTVEQFPDKTAILFANQRFTYQQVDEQATKYASFLKNKGLERGELVALLFQKSPEMMFSILGVIKAGGAYLPLDPNSPFDRLRFTLEDSSARFLLGQKALIKLLNKLQWECVALKHICCVDSTSFYTEREDLNELMKAELWDYISEKSHDDISGGGWFSSYTGADIPRAEMDEYAQNVYLKLKPYLTPETKVLEVGCSFGITMFQVAKEVKSYFGTDLSEVAIEKTAAHIQENKIPNVQVKHLAAHDIDQVPDSGFDIVVINSVIQLFNGHNYLRDVLRKCLNLMNPKGVVFLGDLQDQDKKYELIESLKRFEAENTGKGYQTKTDWSNELFLSREFMEDLCNEFSEFTQADCSEKIHTLKNELTEFRFDCLLKVDKSRTVPAESAKNRYQYDLHELENQSHPFAASEVKPEQLLYVIYTSGSTGRPKGCKITHRNVVRLLFNDKLDFSFSENDTWIMAHSYFFDFSVWEMYGALLYGGKLVVPQPEDSRDVARIHQLVQQHRVTVLNQTPLSFNYFIEEEAMQSTHKLQEHLRYVIFGGDKLDPQKLIPWAGWYPLEQIGMINMYGITETTVHVSYYRLTDEDLKKPGVSPIGRPLPETRIYVLNEQMKPQPIGIPGEMYVGGSGVCDGYLNRDELTKERFIPNPFVEGEMLYRSGDQARWLENGTLEYQGRIDFQVKIRGYRIELGEIESRLNSHAEIQQAAVIAHNKNGENELVAYYVGNLELDHKALRAFIRLELPDFMIPAFFLRIPEIPLTANGKLNKALLPDPYLSDLRGGAELIAPENETEESLCLIWKEVLAMDLLGVTDNFFQIGGDSLKAIRVVVQVNKRFGSGLKVGDIFANQTIRELASRLDDQREGGLERDLEKGRLRISEIKSYVLEQQKEELPEGWQDVYPLSSIEKGMIFSSLLRPEEPVYYDQFTYHLDIRNEAIFRKAFHLMQLKHENLRAAFYMNTFIEPVKVVLKDPELPVVFEDLSKLNHEAQQVELNTYLKTDAQKRLAFEGDVLWHLKAFLLSEGHYYVVWSVHHSILDGWSESSFVTEFANLCSHPDLLQIDHLPVLHSSYSDYVAIQLGRSVQGQASAFWKKHLEGINRNKLPFNLSGKKISNEPGMKRIGSRIDPALNQKLDALRIQLGVPHKAIYLAAYSWLMHLITTENDVLSGCVSNDRPEIEDGDKILGCFLNTIPFRCDFSNIRSGEELIRYFASFLTEVKQHELYLLDIAHAVGEHANTGNPFFDCIFNYTDFHILDDMQQENEGLGYSATASSDWDLQQNNLMTNTLFDVEVDRTGGILTVGIKFAFAYFREGDARRSMQLFENILRCLAEHPGKALHDAQLLDEQEKQWLLHEFNNTLTPFPDQMLMHQLFEQAAESYPKQIALRQQGNEMTYVELEESANRFAHLLLKNGVQSGDKVAIISERHFDLIACLLGILKAGASYVPVDPSYPKDRQLYILNNANARVVLMDSNYEVIEADRSRNYINIQEIRREDFSAQRPVLSKSSLDLAYTIYTSGSTGHPKGVMISHQAAVNLINWVNKTYSVGPADRLLFITSICFDLSVYDIFGILATGASLVIADQEEIRDPEVLQKLMMNEQITFWDSVPTTMNYLVDMIELTDPAYRQDQLRLVFMSGDWIPVTLPERINRYFPNAENISLGGATEGTVWSNYYPIPKDLKHAISIPYGKPIDNNFFYILDNYQRPVPRGVAGELYIGGLGVALGYSDDEDKTNAAFFADPFATIPNASMYKTGDLGRMLPDGNMEFLGRKDFQVKIRGFRVELGEIENQLQGHPAVKRAIVLAKDDGNNSKMLVAYVVSDDWNTESFRLHLSADLPDYMLPGVYIRISQVPVTSNGKIDRNALPDHQEYLTNTVREAPEAGIEQELAEVWKSLLGISFIGRHDSVFELGAHSLHAGAFVSRINKLYAYEIPLRELFNHPQVARQATLINQLGKGKSIEIQVLDEAADYAVSYGQKRLWLIDTLQSGNSAEYNLPATFDVEGDFDLSALEKAVNLMMERHEILRTRLITVNDEPRQIVEKALPFKLEIVDLSQHQLSEQELNAEISRYTAQPFDLKTAPLFRLRIMLLSAEKRILQLVMHHIISDGWSMNLMFSESLRYYQAFKTGQEVQTEKLPLQYKDYAAWLNDINQNSDASRQYWLKQFAEPLEAMNLPADFSRSELGKRIGANYTAHLDIETSAAVFAYCKTQQISTFTFVQAAVQALLHLWSGSTDIRIGNAVSGRPHADLEQQIGFYVNTLVLRHHHKANQRWSDLISAMKKQVLDALEHQLYPLDLLIDELRLPREVSRNPLFDVLISMQNVDAGTSDSIPKLPDTKLNRRQSGLQVSKFDLTFAFYESSSLQLALEYNSELYNHETIGILCQHLFALMKSIVENDSSVITEVKIPNQYTTEPSTISEDLEMEIAEIWRKCFKSELINNELNFVSMGYTVFSIRPFAELLSSHFELEVNARNILLMNLKQLADWILEAQLDLHDSGDLLDELGN